MAASTAIAATIAVRARCSLDLRACCRLGSSPIHLRDPGDGSANPLRALGLAPGAAFGSLHGESKNGEDVSVDLFFFIYELLFFAYFLAASFVLLLPFKFCSQPILPPTHRFS